MDPGLYLCNFGRLSKQMVYDKLTYLPSVVGFDRFLFELNQLIKQLQMFFDLCLVTRTEISFCEHACENVVPFQ